MLLPSLKPLHLKPESLQINEPSNACTLSFPWLCPPLLQRHQTCFSRINHFSFCPLFPSCFQGKPFKTWLRYHFSSASLPSTISPYLSASPLHWSATGARVTVHVRWLFPCECRVCKTRLSFTSSCVPPHPVVGVSWMSTQDLFITLNYLINVQKWASCYARYCKF